MGKELYCCCVYYRIDKNIQIKRIEVKRITNCKICDREVVYVKSDSLYRCTHGGQTGYSDDVLCPICGSILTKYGNGSYACKDCDETFFKWDFSLINKGLFKKIQDLDDKIKELNKRIEILEDSKK